MKQLLIYGANGYTGKLICDEAKRLGLQPVIAGRSANAIAPLAEQYGWPYRIFSLNSSHDIEQQLSDVDVVLHCAGPFRHTAATMLEACLRQKVHYLDISGEIEVFALASTLHDRAVAANVMLMPGTGFDVVPTDWLAFTLKGKMPQATHLELAFVNRGGGVSHGTATSMIGKLGEGSMARVDGKLQPEPMAARRKKLQFGQKEYWVGSIPWGDVFTAWHTTGIPNIRAYTGLPKQLLQLLRWQKLLNPLLRSPFVRRMAQSRIDRQPAGPDAAQRARAYSYVWGQVWQNDGEPVSQFFRCADGYTLTAITAVAIAKRVMDGQFTPGYSTPAQCFGNQLADIIPFLPPLAG